MSTPDVGSESSLTLAPLVAPSLGTNADASPTDVESLIDRFGPMIYRVAHSVLGDVPQTEDATQETLLKVWQNLDSYRGDAPIEHWIARIAHNVSISALRRRREIALDPQEDSPISNRISTSDPVKETEQHFIRAAFETALDNLDELSRTIVVLREIEGFTYESIAETLDLPLPTVKTRLFRARRVLAKELEGWQE